MSTNQDEFKLIRPKFINGIENMYTQMNDIKDEDKFEHVYISDCSIDNQMAYQVSFEGVIFKNVSFQDIALESLELTNVRFENCDLSNVDFKGAIIHRTEFVNCKLIGIDLSNATLQNVYVKECNGKFSFMRFIQMKKVLFQDSLLENSDFQNSKLSKIQFDNCNLQLSQMSGTSLSGIDLSTSIVDGLGVRQEDIRGAIVSPLQAVNFSKLLGLVIKS
ncbi:pentapeptide repeat-containing protein [Inediibacterium massiliense]|uniref:pentapeptide repeat-containing protein n=1 Tax=Inediibacterium massiliense TaxID=1658111 RepID=UPI0006B5A51F|nr:pentapeptide repeat-containing protein [Inediibacterium massiliense]